MATETSKAVRLATCLRHINDKWNLHNPYFKQNEEATACLAFAISSRYWEADGFEWRLAVSYGGNPFPPERGPYIMRPVQPGKSVFGLHLIGIRGTRITLFDNWVDSRRAVDGLTDEQAIQMATNILQELPDSAYSKHFSSYYRMRHIDHEMKHENPSHLEELEVMPVNGFETEEERQAIWEKEFSNLGEWLNGIFGAPKEKTAKARKKSE